MRIHLVTGLALLLASCGKPAVDPVKAPVAQAARICYAAVLQQAMPPEQGRETLSAAALLGPLFHLAIIAVQADKNGRATLADVSDFGSDAQVGRAYRGPALTDSLPACWQRFPLARPGAKPVMPSDPAERGATCLYVARLAPELVAASRGAPDASLSAAREIDARLSHDGGLALQIAQRYKLTSGADADALADSILMGTARVGTLSAIIKACAMARG